MESRAPVAPSTIRLRVSGSVAYGTAVETEVSEALIFDTVSVFIGGGKGAGGMGRARVGTYAVYVHLSNQERGCGRLQEVVPSLVPPKKHTETFAARIASTRPEPNAPFIAFDAADPEGFDIQLMAVQSFRPGVFESEPSTWPAWSRTGSAIPNMRFAPGVKILLPFGSEDLSPCPSPWGGWLNWIEQEDLRWCQVLPLTFPRLKKGETSVDSTFPSGATDIGQKRVLWSIVEPESGEASAAAVMTEDSKGYRVVAHMDAELWSLHADVPAARCPGLRHIHVESED